MDVVVDTVPMAIVRPPRTFSLPRQEWLEHANQERLVGEAMAKRAKSDDTESKLPESTKPPVSTGSSESTASSEGKGPARSQRTKKRILLVDDDGEIIEALRYTLEARGYEICVARDGNQGLVMAEREDPDLVILDMMMPKRSGFLVLERLRRTHAVPMRVIMITANEGSRHKAYAEMLGVDDYIRKPFPMDRLVESVERLLS
jgi:CheY-like chemotaxis protein